MRGPRFVAPQDRSAVAPTAAGASGAAGAAGASGASGAAGASGAPTMPSVPTTPTTSTEAAAGGASARFVRLVGWTSLVLSGVGLAAPARLAALGGVRVPDGETTAVLVRLAAARQGVLGLALLTRRPTDVRRSAELFLPLTTADLAAVLLGVRAGALRPRSAALSTAVLAGNVGTAWVARRARR